MDISSAHASPRMLKSQMMYQQMGYSNYGDMADSEPSANPNSPKFVQHYHVQPVQPTQHPSQARHSQLMAQAQQTSHHHQQRPQSLHQQRQQQQEQHQHQHQPHQHQQTQLQQTQMQHQQQQVAGDERPLYGPPSHQPAPPPQKAGAANQKMSRLDPEQGLSGAPSSPSLTHSGQNLQHLTGYDINSTSGDPINICAILLTAFSLLLLLATFPFSMLFCIKVVQEYERVVIFRLGRLLKGGARGPGIFFIIPCIDTYCKVDLRTVSFDVPPQEILSRDSVTVAVDAVVYYRISNATIAVSNVEDYGRSTRLLAATTLRNVLGTKNLSEILSERETISHIMQSSLDEATEPWGVKVERVEIKDVRLPVQLQRAMAAEAEAAREARAKVIAAEGEQKASKALRNAAEVIAMSPQALQLRYLQTLNSIAAEKNSTIVFPLPLELFSVFQAKPMPMTSMPVHEQSLDPIALAPPPLPPAQQMLPSPTQPQPQPQPQSQPQAQPQPQSQPQQQPHQQVSNQAQLQEVNLPPTGPPDINSHVSAFLSATSSKDPMTAL